VSGVGTGPVARAHCPARALVNQHPGADPELATPHRTSPDGTDSTSLLIVDMLGREVRALGDSESGVRTPVAAQAAEIQLRARGIKHSRADRPDALQDHSCIPRDELQKIMAPKEHISASSCTTRLGRRSARPYRPRSAPSDHEGMACSTIRELDEHY
jgi:hypothetical protein